MKTSITVFLALTLLGTLSTAQVSEEAQETIRIAINSTETLNDKNLRGVMKDGFYPLTHLLVRSIRNEAVDDAIAAANALKKISATTNSKAESMTHIHAERLRRNLDEQDIRKIILGMTRLERLAANVAADLTANRHVKSDVVKGAITEIRYFSHRSTRYREP